MFHCLHRMTTTTKEEMISFRVTKLVRSDLDDLAALRGIGSGPLAATFVIEGLKRLRFQVVDFRDAAPGRVAYLTGTRWPVWMIAQLVAEHDGDCAAAAKQMKKPAALVEMVMRYAKAFPEEIAACLRLNERRAKEARA